MGRDGYSNFSRVASRLPTSALIAVLAWALAGCETPADWAQATSSTSPATSPARSLATEADRVAAALPPVAVAGAAEPPPAPMFDDRTADGSALAGPEIYRGSGVLTGRPAARRPAARVGSDGRITLNFANADVREVINVILGDTLNVSYVIDPRVQGTVTARTSEPLAEAQVIPALENILALNGIAIALEGGVYRVTTIEAAAGRLSRPALRGRLKPGFAINVMAVRYVSAASLRELLQPFIGPGRVLQVDSARNLLIFAGPGTEAFDLEDMVSVFDVDWMAGMSFALVPVEIAEVQAMVTDLEAVFGQDGDSPIAGVIRFVPIERLNAVLVISPQAAYLDQVVAWIGRLDRGSAGAGRRLFVYHVDNSDAVYLAGVLGEIFGLGGTASGVPAASVAPDLEPVEISGRAERLAGGDDGAAGDQAPATGSVVERLAAGAATVTNLISEGGDIRIIADERNNALLVLATAAEYRMIEATLRKIDILPLQVLIEATIAEVTLNNDLRYGLQWFFRQGDFRAGFNANQVSLPPLLGAFPAFPGFADPFPGFSALLNTTDVKVLLNALTAVTDVNVISSPQLMVLDNQTARLQVGDEVPTITGSSIQTTDTTSPVVNNIQYRNTGVILEVKPHVNASGLVVLDVVQEVSNLAGVLLGSPIIAQRKIESIVAVQSGETVALGGLIQDQETDSVSGIPILSDLPLIGNLFKVTEKATKRTELLVLITPRVVRNQAEARRVTDELRRRLSTVTPLEDRIRGHRPGRN